MPDAIFFQAHRGSTDEAPENTIPAFLHAWRFGGAIPETDVRTTRDGELICLHDATLARTTDAPAELRDVDVSGLTLAEIRRWDAGVGLGPQWAGLRVPTLEEVLVQMSQRAGRELYLEPKAVGLDRLHEMLTSFALAEQVHFVSGSRQLLIEIGRLFGNRPTMTWLGGDGDQIAAGFERLAAVDFEGISHLQLHLHVRTSTPSIEYALTPEFLVSANRRLQAVGAHLQLRPFAFDAGSLRRLLDLGVRWFVTDSPQRFSATLHRAEEMLDE